MSRIISNCILRHKTTIFCFFFVVFLDFSKQAQSVDLSLPFTTTTKEEPKEESKTWSFGEMISSAVYSTVDTFQKVVKFIIGVDDEPRQYYIVRIEDLNDPENTKEVLRERGHEDKGDIPLNGGKLPENSLIMSDHPITEYISSKKPPKDKKSSTPGKESSTPSSADEKPKEDHEDSLNPAHKSKIGMNADSTNQLVIEGKETDLHSKDKNIQGHSAHDHKAESEVSSALSDSGNHPHQVQPVGDHDHEDSHQKAPSQATNHSNASPNGAPLPSEPPNTPMTNPHHEASDSKKDLPAHKDSSSPDILNGKPSDVPPQITTGPSSDHFPLNSAIKTPLKDLNSSNSVEHHVITEESRIEKIPPVPPMILQSPNLNPKPIGITSPPSEQPIKKTPPKDAPASLHPEENEIPQNPQTPLPRVEKTPSHVDIANLLTPGSEHQLDEHDQGHVDDQGHETHDQDDAADNPDEQTSSNDNRPLNDCETEYGNWLYDNYPQEFAQFQTEEELNAFIRQNSGCSEQQVDGDANNGANDSSSELDHSGGHGTTEQEGNVGGHVDGDAPKKKKPKTKRSKKSSD